MVIIYASATSPINPPSSSTTSSSSSSCNDESLTQSECWTALEKICHDPVPHIKQITSCRILQESRDSSGHLKTLTRMIRGEGSSRGEVEEIAILKRPVMIEFEFPKTGSFITTILAPGRSYNLNNDGEEEKEKEEIYLTSMYEWHCPEVKRENSAEYRERQEEYFRLAREIVSNTVEEMRKMKKSGLLGGGGA